MSAFRHSTAGYELTIRTTGSQLFSPSTLGDHCGHSNRFTCQKMPWNKGKIVGQKSPLKLKDIWAIRIRLQLNHRTRELALFDLGLDSKLRACDLVKLRVNDICHGDRVSTRAIVLQQKTSLPVQFEITQPTREAVETWIKESSLKPDEYLFPSRVHESPHLGTRQYAQDFGRLDQGNRPGPGPIWNTFHAQNQGDLDLSPHQKS
jgi:hypothetical protein